MLQGEIHNLTMAYKRSIRHDVKNDQYCITLNTNPQADDTHGIIRSWYRYRLENISYDKCDRLWVQTSLL